MELSELLQKIYPYCSDGIPKNHFLIVFIENYIEESFALSCNVLGFGSNACYKIFTGERSITSDDATFILNHRDIDRFCLWLKKQMTELNSEGGIADFLDEIKMFYTDKNIAETVAELATNVFTTLSQVRIKKQKNPLPNKNDLKLISEMQEKAEQLSAPIPIPIPNEFTSDESKYINELFLAYGEAEQIDNFSEKHLTDCPEYHEDLKDRRIDYFAAETIRRAVQEIDATNQFDILKEETLSGVKDTMRKRHENGYERMLSVMETAAQLPTPQSYFLGISSSWINAKIKKGVCHHLVNDNKLKWVKKK